MFTYSGVTGEMLLGAGAPVSNIMRGADGRGLLTHLVVIKKNVC